MIAPGPPGALSTMLALRLPSTSVLTVVFTLNICVATEAANVSVPPVGAVKSPGVLVPPPTDHPTVAGAVRFPVRFTVTVSELPSVTE